MQAVQTLEDPEKFDEYREKLKAKGVRVGPVLNHDESEWQASPTLHPGVYVRSFYFQDPDGHLWEVMWMDPAAAEQGASAIDAAVPQSA